MQPSINSNITMDVDINLHASSPGGERGMDALVQAALAEPRPAGAANAAAVATNQEVNWANGFFSR